MKKHINYILIAIIIMLFTGCGGKSLKCVRISDNDSLKMKEEYYLKFNKSSIKSIDIAIDFDSTSESIDSVDSILQSVNDRFSTFYNNKGISHSSSKKSNGFIFNIKINFNKLSNEVKSKVDIINYMNSYDMVKNDLEQEDFICE